MLLIDGLARFELRHKSRQALIKIPIPRVFPDCAFNTLSDGAKPEMSLRINHRQFK